MLHIFQELCVIDDAGHATEHFGDPAWVYQQYCRRKNDVRSDQELRTEAASQIASVRSRGVFIAEGFGKQPSIPEASLAKHIQHIYDDAKISIWMQLDDAFVATVPNMKRLRTRSTDRTAYILHPVSGEHLSDESVVLIDRYRHDSQRAPR